MFFRSVRWLSAIALSLLLWFLINFLVAEWRMGQGDNGDGMSWPAIGFLSLVTLGCFVGISILVWSDVRRLIEKHKPNPSFRPQGSSPLKWSLSDSIQRESRTPNGALGI